MNPLWLLGGMALAVVFLPPKDEEKVTPPEPVVPAPVAPAQRELIVVKNYVRARPGKGRRRKVVEAPAPVAPEPIVVSTNQPNEGE